MLVLMEIFTLIREVFFYTDQRKTENGQRRKICKVQRVQQVQVVTMEKTEVMARTVPMERQ
jgi:hypothetical protein